MSLSLPETFHSNIVKMCILFIEKVNHIMKETYQIRSTPLLYNCHVYDFIITYKGLTLYMHVIPWKHFVKIIISSNSEAITSELNHKQMIVLTFSV